MLTNLFVCVAKGVDEHVCKSVGVEARNRSEIS